MKIRIGSVMTLVVALLLLGLAAPAQPASAETFVVTLKPGQEARIPFSFWCMDYGKPFPKTVETVGDRAPESVIAVVRAALAKGTTISDPYQTQLAIWRDLEGSFKDFAKQGHVLAQEIYSDSLSIVVPPLPQGEVMLTEVIANGSITTTVEGLTPTQITTPTILAEEAFNGNGTLIVRNVSDKPVRFVVPEGLAFRPVGGENAQRLVSEPRGVPELPKTGSERAELPIELTGTFAAGALLFGIGIAIAAMPAIRARRIR